MKPLAVLLLLNAVWLVLGALSMSSLGELFLRLPSEMLPQWYLAMSTMALVGSAVWLTSVGYERLRQPGGRPMRTGVTRVVTDLRYTAERRGPGEPKVMRNRAIVRS